MADGSATPLPVMHHYQCVTCNKSVVGPYGFWYNCCNSSSLGASNCWRILDNRPAEVTNVYNKLNVKKDRASLSLEEKADEIVEFFNKESDDNAGFQKLQNSLKAPKNLRDLLKKCEAVHYSFDTERWLEFKYHIAKKMATTKPQDNDLIKLSTKCCNAYKKKVNKEREEANKPRSNGLKLPSKA